MASPGRQRRNCVRARGEPLHCSLGDRLACNIWPAGLLAAQGDPPPTLLALQTSLEIALCDWRRFTEVGLGGWGDCSANRRVQAVLDRLDGGVALASEQAYIDAMQREFPV